MILRFLLRIRRYIIVVTQVNTGLMTLVTHVGRIYSNVEKLWKRYTDLTSRKQLIWFEILHYMPTYRPNVEGDEPNEEDLDDITESAFLLGLSNGDEDDDESDLDC